MKIKSLFIALLSVALMAIVGCKEKESVKAPNIQFDKNEVTIGAEGGEASLLLKATREWKASVEEGVTDVTVTPSEGKASDVAVEVKIVAGPNEGQRRTVEITFTAGTVTRSVTLKQDGQQQTQYTSLADVRAMAPADQSQSATIGDGVVVCAYVVSNREINNLTSKKNVYVQDESAGIQIRFAADSEFNFGDELEIDLSGQQLSYYGGSLQINNLPIGNATALSTGNKIEAKEVTVADFMQNKYDGQYVALPNVQVRESDLENTFVMNESHTSINVEDVTGNSFIIFSSKYTTFGGEKVPQGAGTLKGISMINNGTMQIGLTSQEDYAGMTGERFAGAPFMEIDKDEVLADAAGGSFEIKVSSNTAWTASSSASWVTLDPASGNGAATVTVNYEAGESREAVITFTAGSIKAECKVVQPSAQIEELTIAEFLAKEVGPVYYRLTGKITNIENDTYGNFTLEDESGSVYVWGLTAEKQTSNDKSFSTLGLKEGDVLTLEGTRDEHSGKAQVGGPAYYISHEPGQGGGDPDPEVVKATVAEFLAAAVSEDVVYELTGTITIIVSTQYGNLYIEDETGSAYIYGVKASENAGNQSFGEIKGLNVNDVLTVRGNRGEYKGDPQMVNGYYVSHVDGEEPVDPGNILGDVEVVLGQSSYYEKATINGTADVPVLKLGTSSKPGAASFTIPAGTSKITLYAVAWKGKTGSLKLSSDCTITPATIDPASNDGASNNAPYTITSTDSDKYVFDVSGADAEKVVNLESVNRVILWDVQLD